MLDGFAARFGEFLRSFFYGAISNGFAREEPVDFGEFVALDIVGVVVSGYGSAKRCFYVWPVAAIEDVELLKVCQDGEGCLAVPAIADQLEIIFCRSDINERFFCFNEELDLVKIGR